MYDDFTSGYWVRAFVLKRGSMLCGMGECCVTNKQVVRFQELCASHPIHISSSLECLPINVSFCSQSPTFELMSPAM